MKYFYIFFCFLIISCDLPNEADKDCNGEAAGLATIDDCGVCSGGATGIDYNHNMDSCGECFGDNPCLSEGLCNDPDAINHHEEAVIINNSLCIYDLCIEYYESNIDFSCESSNQSPHSIGDQLGCDILETEFDICFPNCSESIKLADFEDKIIFIIYEEDW